MRSGSGLLLRVSFRFFVPIRFVAPHTTISPYYDFFFNWQINAEKRAWQERGRALPTWQKGANDTYVNAFGVFLTIFGVAQLIPGHYRLATGKGKMD